MTIGNKTTKKIAAVIKSNIVGGRFNQTRLEINDGDHFFSKYISTFYDVLISTTYSRWKV